MFSVRLLTGMAIFTIAAVGLLTHDAMGYENRPTWVLSPGSINCDLVGDVIKGDISGGETVSYDFDLTPGKYSFAAWAGLDLTSLSLSIKNENGRSLGLDEGLDNQPLVNVSIAKADKVTAVLTAGSERISGQGGRYALAVGMGENCIRKNISPAEEILENWTDLILADGAEIIYWDILPNTGDSPITLNFTLEQGNYSVIAETLSRKDDIDMYVKLDARSIIAKNEEPDNNPICDFKLDHKFEVMVEIDLYQLKNPDSTEIVVVLAREP